MPRRRVVPVAIASVAVALSSLACTTVCERVREDRRAFEAPTRSAPQPDVALIVPFATLDRVIGPEVKKLGSGKLRLPSVLGNSLGSVALKVESVRTRAAAAGKLGFTVSVALYSGKSRLLAARIEADVPPRFDAKRGVLTASLGQANVKNLTPILDATSKKGLTSWVQRQLPEPIRAFTPTQVVAAAVDALSKELLPQLAQELKRDLPKLFSQVAAVEIDLGGLPLANVTISSTKADLIAAGRTTVARGARLPSLARRPGLPPKMAQLRLSGGTVAGLANQALKSGEIPQRYNLDGSPDPRGPLLARASWDEGKRPMKVHLWKEDGDCIHAVVGATPTIAVERDHLVVGSSDAKLEHIKGSVRVRAGVFFSGLGRRTFELVEKVASTAELEVGDRPLKARVRAAAVDDSEVAVAISLG